jgi:hypothetical protein
MRTLRRISDSRSPSWLASFTSATWFEVPIGDYGETMVRDDETMRRLRRDLVACVDGAHGAASNTGARRGTLTPAVGWTRVAHGLIVADGTGEGERADQQRMGAPYEAALTAALNRLTSEVLVFLLAYTILLVGLSVLGGAIVPALRALFYVIPVLGVGAYVLLRRRRAVRSARRQGVDVGSLLAGGRATVVGVRGRAGVSPNVRLRSGIAGGDAVVAGYDAPPSGVPDELVEIYERLDRAGRLRLLEAGSRILAERDAGPP